MTAQAGVNFSARVVIVASLPFLSLTLTRTFPRSSFLTTPDIGPAGVEYSTAVPGLRSSAVYVGCAAGVACSTFPPFSVIAVGVGGSC